MDDHINAKPNAAETVNSVATEPTTTSAAAPVAPLPASPTSPEAKVPTHFSQVDLSNWQSAVAKHTTSPAYKGAPASDRPLGRKFLDFGDDLVTAAATAAQRYLQGAAISTGETIHKAEIALHFAQAQVNHDNEAMKKLEEHFTKYGALDPEWAECVSEFVSHYMLTINHPNPYKHWKAIDDFTENTLAANCRIGIIGDWGTNDKRAQMVLETLAEKKIDILVHLGDVYFTCTPGEASAFFTNVQAALGPYDKATKTFGPRKVRVLSLCGNHDMYSGGSPYYGLIERLGQPASFFSLCNEDWQLLAGDTGFRDFNPISMGGGAVGMQDFDGKEPTYSEVTWHRRQLDVAKAVGRKTIFMTHHQPFTFNAVIDGNSGINTKLLPQLAPYADGLDLWLWGHEHNQVVYEPFKGIKRGRCIGASAIPVWENDELYTLNKKIVGEYAPAKLGPDFQLGIEQKSRRYRLGYCTIEINGKVATETYYELDTETAAERVLYTSKF